MVTVLLTYLRLRNYMPQLLNSYFAKLYYYQVMFCIHC